LWTDSNRPTDDNEDRNIPVYYFTCLIPERPEMPELTGFVESTHILKYSHVRIGHDKLELFMTKDTVTIVPQE